MENGMRYLGETIKLELDREKCTGCSMCVSVCPHAVFEMAGPKAAIIDKGACMECGACAKNCPAKAIESGAGVGCAYAIISGMLTGSEPSCDCSSSAGDGKKSSCCG